MAAHISEPPRAKRSGFRDDIQGMRALAVLGIIVYHAGIAPYSGGFVTLDVFFVLSGYLITYLLLREIGRDGTISMRAFYTRRARRILPAATVATVGTVVASWLWLSLVEAHDVAYDAIWAAFFAANIRFALEETDYFAAQEPASPLQHYWSLAVEEQFYLGLPALLLGCLWLAHRRRRRASRPVSGNGAGAGRASTTTIAIVLGVVSLLSFAWSVWASHHSPETAYFSTFTRTWEFGVGALLALGAARLAAPLTAVARNLMVVVGLAAIAVALFIVTPATPFPGYAALLPVFGTGAVLLAGAELPGGAEPGMSRLLGVRPLRAIGDASYSIYLWHWPVLAVASQHVGRDLRPAELGVVLAVTALLSWASYRWVETPFRTGRVPTIARGLVLYPLTMSVVLAGSAAAITGVNRGIDQAGTPITTQKFDRAPNGGPLDQDPAIALVQASVRAAQEGARAPRDLSPSLLDLRKDKADQGDCDYEEPPWRLCRRGDEDAERTIVVLGNSHGRHWIPAFEKIAEHGGYRTYYLVKSRCSPARVDLVLAGQSEPWDECADFNRWATRKIAALNPELLVISTSGVPAVSVDGEVLRDTDGVSAEVGRGFAELIDDVTPLAERVAVLEDIPRRDEAPGECLSMRDATLKACLARSSARADKVTDAMRAATEETSAVYVPTRQWFCSAGVCPAVIGTTVPLRDRGHLTTVYAEQLAEPLGKELRAWRRR